MDASRAEGEHGTPSALTASNVSTSRLCMSTCIAMCLSPSTCLRILMTNFSPWYSTTDTLRNLPCMLAVSCCPSSISCEPPQMWRIFTYEIKQRQYTETNVTAQTSARRGPRKRSDTHTKFHTTTIFRFGMTSSRVLPCCQGQQIWVLTVQRRLLLGVTSTYFTGVAGRYEVSYRHASYRRNETTWACTDVFVVRLLSGHELHPMIFGSNRDRARFNAVT